MRTKRFHKVREQRDKLDRDRVQLILMLDKAANYCPPHVQDKINELLLAVSDTQRSFTAEGSKSP